MQPILQQPYDASSRTEVLIEVQRNVLLPLSIPVPKGVSLLHSNKGQDILSYGRG